MLFLLLACGKSEKPTPPPPEAGYVIVKTEAVPLETELAGRTSPYETSEVRPQVSGIVRNRLFTEGSVVRAGQTLYQIDPSLYQAAADQARANLRNADAARIAAQARAQRYRPLVEMEAVSKQDYADAAASAAQAAAAVAQTQAQLQTANINLRFTRVPAPITGRIGRSLVTTGALVTNGQAEPMTTIQRLDPMFVDIQQSSADLLRLRQSLSQGGSVPTAATVTLELEDGSDYPVSGTLQFTEPVVDPATGTVTLRARFPNPSGLLLPGMYVRAKLSQQTVLNGILVPQQGVSRDPKGNATVMLIDRKGKAERRNVTADRTVGDKWLVTEGLRSGDRLIIEGLGRVKAGEAVTAVPAGSESRPRQATNGAAGGAAKR